VPAELLGELVRLRGLIGAPALLQCDDVGIGLAQGRQQAVLPPGGPEAPPHVPGDDAHSPNRCLSHAVSSSLGFRLASDCLVTT
jgi:hypothetical protein